MEGTEKEEEEGFKQDEQDLAWRTFQSNGTACKKARLS